jgi:predicted HicB family RNase H-like nuclease
MSAELDSAGTIAVHLGQTVVGTEVNDPKEHIERKEPIMPELAQRSHVEEKRHEAYRVAAELYRQDPDWVTFFREVMGVDGVVRRLFPSTGDMANFEQTQQYAEIQQMVAKLRERSVVQSDGREPTRVITVRLPKSLHESLRVEAHQRRTSMNQLCISKLLQQIADALVPIEE